ncbi:MAG: hypothetical protein QMD25_03580 [Caldisericia bacterium]|nr:hypothetical protein [Caldisericia bacterium]
MERFEEFLKNVKKIEIKDEEFKEELKKRLFELYDKRKERARKLFYKKVFSFATIIILIILPTIFIYKNLSLRNKALFKPPETFKTMNQIYDEEINKIISNDEIEKVEIDKNGTLIKKFKSGIIVFEKDGNFEKLIYNENFLKENNIDLNEIEQKEETFKIIDRNLIDKILNVLKKDQRFEFINENNLSLIKIIKDNLFFIKVLGNRGFWIIILDLEVNKIQFFVYPS